MLQLDETPIPSVEGRPDITRGVALPLSAQAMYSTRCGLAVPRPQCCPARPRRRLLRVTTCISGTTVTARGPTPRGIPDDSLHGLRRTAHSRTGRCHRAKFTDVAPRLLPTHNRQLLLHVLPGVDRSASRDHRSRCRTDPALRYGWQHCTPLQGTRAMADTLEDGHLIVVEAISTGCLERVAVCRRAHHRLPRRPRPARRRGH